jgi:hypothetical protein
MPTFYASWHFDASALPINEIPKEDYHEQIQKWAA